MTGQQEFEVACMLPHRRKGRGLEYLVECAGNDLADAAWKPERHLAHSQDHVA